MRTVVNLDGGRGERLKETLAALDETHPGRFWTFALIGWVFLLATSNRVALLLSLGIAASGVIAFLVWTRFRASTRSEG